MKFSDGKTLLRSFHIFGPMEIKHDKTGKRHGPPSMVTLPTWNTKSSTALLDILHTFVPKPLEGQGIASELVKFVYDYALEQGFGVSATCSYAAKWLENTRV